MRTQMVSPSSASCLSIKRCVAAIRIASVYHTCACVCAASQVGKPAGDPLRQATPFFYES
jgi:hypothetical protein